MRKVSSLSACIHLLFLIISISSVTFFHTSDAGAQPPTCILNIGKNAAPGTDQIFSFTVNNLSGPLDFEVPDGGGTTVSFDQNFTTTFIEHVPEGWVLGGVECTNVENFTITDIENGIEVMCNVPDSEGLCIFNNFSVSRPIPTLSEWGMIAAAAGLGFVGVFFAVRRRKAHDGVYSHI